MHVNDDQPGVPGYVSIKEAAEILSLSPSRVYEYVEDGRLSSVRAAHVILIPLDEVKNFKPGIAGRPRKSVLRWRSSPGNNMLLSTSITVEIKADCQDRLAKRLEEIRQSDNYLLPGTVARFIMKSKTYSGMLNILLVWRTTAIPDDATREQSLNDFRQVLADVVDWSRAQYDDSEVLIHT